MTAEERSRQMELECMRRIHNYNGCACHDCIVAAIRGAEHDAYERAAKVCLASAVRVSQWEGLGDSVAIDAAAKAYEDAAEAIRALKE